MAREIWVKRVLHKILMRVIPWKFWGWRDTSRLMRLNYWANEKEFLILAHGQLPLTQRALDIPAEGHIHEEGK